MLRLLVVLVAIVLLVIDIVLASIKSPGVGIGFSVLLIYLGLVASFLWIYRR
jgi:hypothetical protein